jgi:hypothetical protein
MSTNLSANLNQLISNSLTEGESFSDFVYLLNALIVFRRPYHEDLETSGLVAGRLLCVLVPDKPERYVRAMQEYRLRFSGVSTDPELQAEFFNCVRNAALSLSDPALVVWRPSLYFLPSPTLHENLEEWY